jgi:cytoskeletal protein CcmA (bactofilin family)
LTAVTAEIAGEINGNANVSELLTLKSTAVMNADVEYGKIMIEEGAALNGMTRMAGAVIKDISSGGRRKDRSADESGKGESKIA